MSFNKPISTLFARLSNSTPSTNTNKKVNNPKASKKGKSLRKYVLKSLFQAKKQSSQDQPPSIPIQNEEIVIDSEITLADSHIGFDELLEDVYDEIKYALDSRGTIYYESDLQSAHEAFNKCTKYLAERIKNLDENAETKYYLDLWSGKIKDVRSELNELLEATLSAELPNPTLSLKKNKVNNPKPFENRKSLRNFVLKRLFQSKKRSSQDQPLPIPVQNDEIVNDSEITLVDVRSEFEGLLEDVDDEIKYALDSYETSYYEGDLESAHEAFDRCTDYLAEVKQTLEENAESKYYLNLWIGKIKDLQSELNKLPKASNAEEC
ncbi:hypothetical protein [Parasitella parasitica]|uniref:Uncharacterized protein n=1 Tax=Parasitella parasitica TaxID=35722 RepID=A0A0B7MSP9_9FUNG|nr:hypothetical protein [Parasitella parasitica]